jgi:hypothetical protein
MPDLA